MTKSKRLKYCDIKTMQMSREVDRFYILIQKKNTAGACKDKLSLK
jgi:hypothetical protein